MLYNLLSPLADDYIVFNLVRYLTFRTGAALLTALIICFIVGPRLIAWLKQRQLRGQPIREDGPAGHILAKAGTPTMGGLLILIGLSVATLLWADLTNRYVWACLIVTLGFGLTGFIDDYLKVAKANPRGVPGNLKLVIEAALAALIAAWIASIGSPTLALPFAKDLLVNLAWFYPIFALLVMVGSANAVNLTDGLDGLAIMPVIVAAGAFGLIAYVVGNTIYADYLQLTYIVGSGELAVFCGAIIGAGLGFLWYNAPPAMVFMGDTGSLSLGGALGVIAVVTKHELVLVIIGGLFVLETVSVIVQVVSFRLTGRRVFRMAPLHHHFEHKGWSEPTIVIRFWIIAVVLALIGLASLKLR